MILLEKQLEKYQPYNEQEEKESDSDPEASGTGIGYFRTFLPVCPYDCICLGGESGKNKGVDGVS